MNNNTTISYPRHNYYGEWNVSTNPQTMSMLGRIAGDDTQSATETAQET
jgi:hypothetical protein